VKKDTDRTQGGSGDVIYNNKYYIKKKHIVHNLM